MASSGTFSGTHFSGSWDTSNINVTSGSGSLADLYADINDPEPFSNPSAGVYQVNGNRELRLQSGVTLDIGSDTLQWDLSTSKYPILRVYQGATLIGGAGGKIIGDINNTYYSYIYFYGTITLQGSSGNNFVIEQYRTIYLYERTTSTYTFDYVTLQNNTYTYGYYIYWNRNDATSNQNSHSFTNITIQSNNHKGYGMLLYGDFSNVTFSNITIDDTRYGFYLQAATAKFTNCTVRDTYLDSLMAYGASPTWTYGHYTTSKTKQYNLAGWQQGKVVFENCTWHDNRNSSSTEMCVYYVGRGSVVLFKNNTFEGASAADPSSYGIGVYYGGLALYYGTQTFTNVTTERYWSSNGTHLHCRKLTLTVKDQNGNPVEDAYVIIRQNEGKEEWTGFTDSNGQLKDIFGDDYVVVEKEETSTGNYTQWSDSIANGRFHWLIISKEGYQTWQRKITFTADKTITATLMPVVSRKELPDAF
ncbi:MAG: right-handed parallel beta-helix repeat-containing protein [Candidatus Heimdallarchaeaceae archaeon]